MRRDHARLYIHIDRQKKNKACRVRAQGYKPPHQAASQTATLRDDIQPCIRFGKPIDTTTHDLKSGSLPERKGRRRKRDKGGALRVASEFGRRSGGVAEAKVSGGPKIENPGKGWGYPASAASPARLGVTLTRGVRRRASRPMVPRGLPAPLLLHYQHLPELVGNEPRRSDHA